MRRILSWLCVVSLVGMPGAWAAPDTTLTIDPVAVSGNTILASEENNRNADVSTAYNAHSHSDLSSSTANTFNFGDGTASNKSLCANAADAIDRCVRWDDTNDVWVIDQVTAGSFNQIMTASATAALTNNALLVGTGGLGVLDDPITLAGTQPSTYGDVSARARNSAAISLTSGTATILTMDSERWDTDSIHSTSSNTGRLTATTAGKYQISGHVEFALSEVAGLRRIQIRLNGSTLIATQDCEARPLGDVAVSCSISTHYNLAATDYVELIATQRVVSTLNVNATSNYSPEFEMVKVP